MSSIVVADLPALPPLGAVTSPARHRIRTKSQDIHGDELREDTDGDFWDVEKFVLQPGEREDDDDDDDDEGAH